jgi:tight adherence protein B
MNLVGVVVALVVFVCSARLLYVNLTRDDGPQVVWPSSLAAPGASPFKRLLGVLEINLEPLFFVAGMVLIGTAVALAFVTVFPHRPGLSALAGISFLPISYFVLKDLFLGRAQRFEHALVDVLELMAALTASGVAPLQALKTAAGNSPRGISVPLLGIASRLTLGDSIENATRPVLDTYRSEGVRLFVMALRSRWHDGPHFESLLRALSSTLRQRRRFTTQVRGQLSGARYALLFSAGFPYLLVPFFMWKEPDWLRPLTDAPMGPMVLYAAIVCQIAGLLWMRTIMRRPSW